MSRRKSLWRRVIMVGAALVAASVGAGALAIRPVDPTDWRPQLWELSPRTEAGHVVQPLADGGRAQLTLDAALQADAERLLADADAVHGAAVVVDVADGRVLALAGRSRATPGRNDLRLPLGAWAPAASVFKLVTTAALLDAGVKPDTKVCYHAGTHSIEADNLEVAPALDDRCRNLAYGLAKSQNAILGRLAHDYLNPQTLDEHARALGFGAAPAFALPAAPSALAIPVEPLAFARTAAGFWHTTLSPLHGALLAATIARGGEMPGLRWVERVTDAGGREQPLPAVAAPHRALNAETAATLGRMMINTTEWGSATRAFHDGKRRILGHVRVAGKTGTLNGDDPALLYSWFVGFAPADDPKVAFAVLLARGDESEVKAAEVARALVGSWLGQSATPAASQLASR